MRFLLPLFCLISISSTALGYTLVRDYRGAGFFTNELGEPLWDYYGSWDNLTGCVYFLNLIFCIRLTLYVQGRRLLAGGGFCPKTGLLKRE